MRRNTYKRKKSRRATKRKQRRIFSRKLRKPRKQSGGGIPNDNVVKGFTKQTVVAPIEIDSDGYSEAPTMRLYGDYMEEQS
jgi:hypothetical protein